MKILWKYKEPDSHAQTLVGIILCCERMSSLLISGRLLNDFILSDINTVPHISISPVLKKKRSTRAFSYNSIYLKYCPNCGEKVEILEVKESENIMTRIFN